MLHIYGQKEWHDDVLILGNEKDLIKLKEAIESALNEKKGVSSSRTSDKEGYEIIVLKADDLTESYWESIEIPYTEVDESYHIHEFDKEDIIAYDYVHNLQKETMRKDIEFWKEESKRMNEVLKDLLQKKKDDKNE